MYRRTNVSDDRSEPTVRPATDADVPAILDCLRSAFEPYRGAYTPAAYQDTVLTEPTARERLAGMRVKVAVDNQGEVAGTLAWRWEAEGVAHLRGMAVLPRAQGSRVAQRLLEAILAELSRTGFRRVTLNTTAPLHRAISFYERNGFRRTGRVSDFSGMELTEWVRDV
jgi:ribosomal protein S18 acetylase RimI-like enzyme